MLFDRCMGTIYVLDRTDRVSIRAVNFRSFRCWVALDVERWIGECIHKMNPSVDILWLIHDCLDSPTTLRPRLLWYVMNIKTDLVLCTECFDKGDLSLHDVLRLALAKPHLGWLKRT